MQVARVNGVHLHYAEFGDKGRPPLVFANSLGTDFRIWRQVIDLLGDKARFIVYDKRGHGLSSAPDAPYSLDDHVADLAALLDHLSVTGAVVCGLSVGGMIAQGLAASRPDLVSALILCDTAHKIGPAEMWDTRIGIIREGGIEALADPVMERWFSARFRAGRADEVVAWRNMLTRTPVEGYVGTCAALRDADLTAGTAALALPVLCVCGSEDGATPPDLVRAMADLIEGADFKLIDGAGHLPCVESPDQLAGMMEEFLERKARA